MSSFDTALASTARVIRDEAAALACAGGDTELAAELLDTLLVGLEAELASLRACLARDDWQGLIDYAHQMRGASRYGGVPALDLAHEQLERAARSGDPQRNARCLQEVELQAGLLRDAFAPL